MQRKTLGSIVFASAILLALGGSAYTAELAKPLTVSERHYAQRNIAQDADSGALPPSEGALVPEPDTADAVPARVLQSLPVKSRDGQAVGRVQKIELASNGHARVLQVAVGGKIVALQADQVWYDPQAHTVLASMTRDAIVAMSNGEGVTASIEPKLY
ncbi:MAG: hypothetical protein WAW96_13100 [Alphaproteobacteria bacterium]